MTAIRSASWSASSRYCVVSSTVQPWATSSRMVSHIWPRVRGSRPVVGSSRKISGGRVIRLAARSSRRRMPPENCEIGLSAASSRPNRPSRSSAVVRALLDASALQPAEQPEVLAGGEVLVDRGVLAGDADQLAHHVRVLRDVDAEDLGAAAVHRQQGREHLQHRGLAGAVGAEDAEDLAAATSRSMPSTARRSPKVFTRPCAETASSVVGEGFVFMSTTVRVAGFSAPSRRFHGFGPRKPLAAMRRRRGPGG